MFKYDPLSVIACRHTIYLRHLLPFLFIEVAASDGADVLSGPSELGNARLD